MFVIFGAYKRFRATIDMSNGRELKAASLILFWFGVIAELLVIIGALGQFYYEGYSRLLTPFKSSDILLNIANFVYTAFAHFVHMVSAYWLAKGTRKGIILAFCLSIYEIVPFLAPEVEPTIYTVRGFGIRVIFGIVIVLLVLGRKDLLILKSAKWRPWNYLKQKKTIIYVDSLICDHNK